MFSWPITNVAQFWTVSIAVYLCLAGGLTLFICAVLGSGTRADEDRVISLEEARADGEMLFHFANHADRASRVTR